MVFNIATILDNFKINVDELGFLHIMDSGSHFDLLMVAG